LRSNPKLLSGITSTTEIIWWHVLEATRQPNAAKDEVAAGLWDRSNHFSMSLAGRNLGIVGFGRIGKQIAEVAKAFQMNILVSDVKLDTSGYSFVKASSTSEIFQSCSIVVIAVTDSHENVDLIDEKYLSLIPEDGTVLINCSRGRILNESHVKKYFLRNRIKSLGLDVLKNETQSENKIAIANLYFAQAEALEKAANRTHFAARKKKETRREALELYRLSLSMGNMKAQNKIDELEKKLG
jgi:phosphoglycerate dehydrogenase-like enzyme